MSGRIRAALGLCVLLLVAGCATRGGPPAPEDPGARRVALEALLAPDANWEARGRIAVKSAASSGQGNFTWAQAGESARIQVSGPFGAGAYAISWDPQRLTVTSSSGEVAVDYAGADAAEQVLAEQLGWSLPVASVRYWLLGLPGPGTPVAESRDESGRLAALSQGGWNLQFQEYRPQRSAAGDVWLPRRLVMESDTGRVRLVIDAWEL